MFGVITVDYLNNFKNKLYMNKWETLYGTYTLNWCKFNGFKTYYIKEGKEKNSMIVYHRSGYKKNSNKYIRFSSNIRQLSFWMVNFSKILDTLRNFWVNIIFFGKYHPKTRLLYVLTNSQKNVMKFLEDEYRPISLYWKVRKKLLFIYLLWKSIR